MAGNEHAPSLTLGLSLCSDGTWLYIIMYIVHAEVLQTKKKKFVGILENIPVSEAH